MVDAIAIVISLSKNNSNIAIVCLVWRGGNGLQRNNDVALVKAISRYDINIGVKHQ